MGMRERTNAKLSQLHEKRRSIDAQIKLLESLFVVEEKSDDEPRKKRAYKKRKSTNSKLPPVKRTPLLGDVDDPEVQAQNVPRQVFTRDVMFKHLKTFGKKGALLSELMVSLNENRTGDSVVKNGRVSTMLAHLAKDPRFKNHIKRKRTKGSTSYYRYVFVGP